jgi:hypothetical protein
MRNVSGLFCNIRQLASLLTKLGHDTWRFLILCLRPAPALAAENLFLCKQLALYEERQVKPRRATNATRLAMVWLAHWFDWRSALRIVKPDPFTNWHRQGFRLFWRWKSKLGRPALPKDLQALIRRMALDNLPWGQERIANELLLKLGLRILKTPVRTPVANAICERAIGTLRRECLDFVIPLNKKHLSHTLKDWGAHYNQGRPHMSLGPGIPLPIQTLPVPQQAHQHQIPTGQCVMARPVIGGLHHEYRLQQKTA